MGLVGAVAAAAGPRCSLAVASCLPRKLWACSFRGPGQLLAPASTSGELPRATVVVAPPSPSSARRRRRPSMPREATWTQLPARPALQAPHTHAGDASALCLRLWLLQPAR